MPISSASEPELLLMTFTGSDSISALSFRFTEEAKAYDDFAVGLCKDGKDRSGGSDVLVGHAPIELSHLVCTFLNAEDSNEGDAEVIGKRTLEIKSDLLFLRFIHCEQGTRTYPMC